MASISMSTLIVSIGAPASRSASLRAPVWPPPAARAVRARVIVSGLYWNTMMLASGLSGSIPTIAPLIKRGEPREAGHDRLGRRRTEEPSGFSSRGSVAYEARPARLCGATSPGCHRSVILQAATFGGLPAAMLRQNCRRQVLDFHGVMVPVEQRKTDFADPAGGVDGRKQGLSSPDRRSRRPPGVWADRTRC